MGQTLKEKTASGLLWGGIGNGAMQLLSLLFGIFLSRILSPADYGTIGALTIFIALAGMLSESGFLLALVNTKQIDREDYNAVFWFNLAIGLMCYGILYLCAPLVADFYQRPEMTALLRFLSLGFVVSASATAPTAWLFRNLMVKQRSRAQITAMVISGIVGVGCALAGLSYWSLAIQTLTHTTVYALMIWLATPWHPTLSFNPGRLVALLPFSLKQLAVTFFNHVSNNIFPVLLGRFYGMAITGFYTQGSKWVNMGSSTIKGTIDSVGQPVLRQTIDEPERLARVFRKLLRFTALLSFPAMLGLAIVARELILLTITAKWLPCVPVMQILCAGAAITPIVTLYGNLFNSLNRPNIYMWNTIICGLTQLTLICLTYRAGLNVMLAVYVGVNILWLGVWQFFASRHAGVRFRQVLADVTPYAAATLLALGIALLAARPLDSPLLSLPVKIVVAAGVYCLLMWRLKSQIFREALHFLFKKKIC